MNEKWNKETIDKLDLGYINKEWLDLNYVTSRVKEYLQTSEN